MSLNVVSTYLPIPTYIKKKNLMHTKITVKFYLRHLKTEFIKIKLHWPRFSTIGYIYLKIINKIIHSECA